MEGLQLPKKVRQGGGRARQVRFVPPAAGLGRTLRWRCETGPCCAGLLLYCLAGPLNCSLPPPPLPYLQPAPLSSRLRQGRRAEPPPQNLKILNVLEFEDLLTLCQLLTPEAVSRPTACALWRGSGRPAEVGKAQEGACRHPVFNGEQLIA